jgi:ABC-type multidrug transport system fused ATPase/permease subunit
MLTLLLSYPALPSKPIIKNFTLTIRSRETLAIVGTDGSGKSTLAQLLLRFYVAQRKWLGILHGFNLHLLSSW